jgi:hypothetical protein
MEAGRSDRRGDALAALALAFVLSAVWALRDWPNLSVLHLPDTDDVMRLQQVRDWLGGQRFADVSQHRMGAGLVPMHWSRLADLLPAAWIAGLTPIVGGHRAEIAAVIATPAILFALSLFLVAQIAGLTAGAGAARTAAVVAAVAYPATTIFLPGRIDHHGLQVVLLLATCLLLLRPTTVRGACAGVLAAASLVVGLETAAMLAALGLCVVVAWIWRGLPEARTMASLGIAAAVTLIIARGALATDGWSYPACDGFNASLWQAALPLASVPILLACANGALATWRARLAAAAIMGLAAGLAALKLAPDCLSPYGAVDPELARLWLANVGEAQSPFTAPLATAVGYLGLMLVGLIATIIRLRRDPSRGWMMLLAVQLAALAVSIVQLRGAYAGAMFAAPALAVMIGAARRRGTTLLVAVWFASAGMLYPLVAGGAVPQAQSLPGATCDRSQALATLGTMGPGVVIAPIDTGAWGIAATPHRFLAAPYHRNAAANLATFHFFLGSAGPAREIAKLWRTDYVLVCPNDLDPLSPAPGSLIRQLEAGRAPAWLRPLTAAQGSLLYRVVR